MGYIIIFLLGVVIGMYITKLLVYLFYLREE